MRQERNTFDCANQMTDVAEQIRQHSKVHVSTDNDNPDWRTLSSQIFEHLTKLDEQESPLLRKMKDLIVRRSRIRLNLTELMRELTYENEI